VLVQLAGTKYRIKERQFYGVKDIGLTPWSRVLPEKLKCPELLKKFTAFYGTRRFITVYTRARHLSLS
jgi:hypothetical protein